MSAAYRVWHRIRLSGPTICEHRFLWNTRKIRRGPRIALVRRWRESDDGERYRDG